MPAALLIFPPDPELRLRDPIDAATDHVRVAVVDYAIAIQEGNTCNRLCEIRRQVAARILELEAIEHMAFEKWSTLL